MNRIITPTTQSTNILLYTALSEAIVDNPIFIPIAIRTTNIAAIDKNLIIEYHV